MKRINVNLFELQAFRQLAELGSFRAASEEIGLSGPALSRLIARVEERLDTRLFDRDTRNVRLTPQGEALLGLTGRILNETERALTEFDGYLAARRGSITIAGLPSVTAGFLPGFLLAALFILTVAATCLLRPGWGGEKLSYSWGERLRALPALVPPLGIFLVVVGSIYAGIATPTEAAALGVVAAMALAAFNGKFSISMMREAWEAR